MTGDDDIFGDLVRDPNAVADEGAALDGTETDGALSRLPRFLRLALTRVDERARLVADCRDMAPDLLEEAARWSDHSGGTGCDRSRKGAGGTGNFASPGGR